MLNIIASGCYIVRTNYTRAPTHLYLFLHRTLLLFSRVMRMISPWGENLLRGLLLKAPHHPSVTQHSSVTPTGLSLHPLFKLMVSGASSLDVRLALPAVLIRGSQRASLQLSQGNSMFGKIAYPRTTDGARSRLVNTKRQHKT